MLAAAALLCAFAGTLALAHARVQPPQTAPAFDQSSMLSTHILNLHNHERARLGIAPLLWSDRLAADARAWAETMARGQFFAHSPDRLRAGQGENLFRGTAGAYSLDEMIDDFVAERADFHPGRFPDVAQDGVWENVGHFTQLIWPGTREVGCAVVRAGGWDYLACRYSPAGNVIGVRLL